LENEGCFDQKEKTMRTADVQLLDPDYERKLLQQVSRSFALTIPQLPLALRRAVTNAYLVCRIVDTIEDAGSLSLDQKRFFFQEFIKVMNGQTSAKQFGDSLSDFLSGRARPEERELIRNTPAIIQTTLTFNEKQQAAIIHCATIMAQGMLGFQETKSLQGLKDLSAFDRYCYHVAGVVGEMLTELFCAYSPEISKRRERLLQLAVSFGQGLQMTNIIKDLWEDRDHGACWLPQDVFQEVGYDLRNLSSVQYTDAFGEGLAALIGIARAHLQDALAYTLMIPPHETGIRRFCLWAIGMAILTLRKINKRRNYKNGQEVKILRRSVKAIIRVTNATLWSNFLLKRLFALSTRGLPISRSIRGDDRQ
jgi:farnesyl-diphosphate farnesyltransferase